MSRVAVPRASDVMLLSEFAKDLLTTLINDGVAVQSVAGTGLGLLRLPFLTLRHHGSGRAPLPA